MDFVHSLYKKEIGYRTVNSYDLAIKRLKCYNYNEFCGVYVNTRAQNYQNSPVFACKFCCKTNYQHWIALANEDGMIAIQDTNVKGRFPLGGDTYAEGTHAHNDAIFDLAWMEEEMKLVSVSGDNTAVLWDVSMMPFRRLHHFKGHTKSVKTVAFRPQDKAVFATGARDGFIMIWDTRSNQGLTWDKPDNFISNSHPAQQQGVSPGGYGRSRRNKGSQISRANSITGLIFQDEYRLISCGAGDGLIKVWDLRKNYSAYRREPHPCYTLKYPRNTTRNGFTNLVLDPGRVKLYANCMDDVIYCYNVATYQDKPVASYHGHNNCTFYVKSSLSPDGLYLASGSSNERAYIWNTRGSGSPLVSLVGHAAEVTSVQWCPHEKINIVTCSDDCRHRIWCVGLDFEGDNAAVDVRGWAEVPEVTNRKMMIEDIETTPRAMKQHISRQERTPDSQYSTNTSSDEARCRNCTGREHVTPCSACLSQSMGESPKSSIRTSKRRLSDFMGGRIEANRVVLSPVREENQETATVSEVGGTCRHCSPSKSSDANSTVDSSPTLNLPNYVLDGTSPHHRCSSNNRLKENVDWLTRYRKEKSASGDRVVSSPNSQVIPKRRLTRSRSHDYAKGTSPKGNSETLLRFFHIAGKASSETWNCSTQGTSSSIVPTSETDNSS
ncbi:hypothetical protein L9F63_016232 [Diploptera punctata]|uniref:Protein lethal(2)denticleless n=1 Tax=Diploptera punctata TaxID=6984 RepID=A0AAD8A2E1_DIPPU|nr:hypothetical protein L9F63_016232 [Diploptera punctata]